MDILSLHDRVSPHLKDTQITSSSYPALYQELILNACKMFHQCKLIHTNLSEYNILYHEDHLFMHITECWTGSSKCIWFLGKNLKNIKELFGRDARLQLFQFINCLKWFIMVYVYVYLQVTL